MRDLFSRLAAFLLIIALPFAAQASNKDTKPADMAKELKDLDKCEKTKVPSQDAIANAFMMASQTIQYLRKVDADLQAKGQAAEVVLLGRTGTDTGSSILLKDENLRSMINSAKSCANHSVSNGTGDKTRNCLKKSFRESDPKRSLKYSHVGIAFRDHPRGEWWIVHLLSPCYTTTSQIYDEGMVRFWVDDPYDFGALVMVPSMDIQKRLKDLIFDPRFGQDMKAPVYNVAALPKNTNEENSNGWPLDMLIAASRPEGEVRNRLDAYRAGQAMGYRPSAVLLGGKAAMAATAPAFLVPDYVNIRSSEHPFATDYQVAEVVSALSIQEFAQRNNLLIHMSEYRLPDGWRFDGLPDNDDAKTTKKKDKKKKTGNDGK